MNVVKHALWIQMVQLTVSNNTDVFFVWVIGRWQSQRATRGYFNDFYDFTLYIFYFFTLYTHGTFLRLEMKLPRKINGPQVSLKFSFLPKKKISYQIKKILGNGIWITSSVMYGKCQFLMYFQSPQMQYKDALCAITMNNRTRPQANFSKYFLQ